MGLSKNFSTSKPVAPGLPSTNTLLRNLCTCVTLNAHRSNMLNPIPFVSEPPQPQNPWFSRGTFAKAICWRVRERSIFLGRGRL